MQIMYAISNHSHIRQLQFATHAFSQQVLQQAVQISICQWFAEMALPHHHGENTVWRSKAILVIICLLTSLMKDQVNYLQKLNISATYVASDQPESILSSVEQGNYNLVFISPESTLNNERWR